ncbi:MAG TPA: hypothetical protein VJ044_08485 [Candidatus Hodarchaeales archaeon]|nr:hypothetical protein [Candidatus Hodarchaeales archaeon]
MAKKINGEFLHIEDGGDRFKLDYVCENGELESASLSKKDIKENARFAELLIEDLKEKLAHTQDEREIRRINKSIERFEIEAVWPEMYVAYRRGEDVSRFFEKAFHPDDTLFNNTLPAFKKAIQNRFHERREELHRRMSDVIVSKERLGKISDPIFPRYALYREHATKFGDDFLRSFTEIIKPYCRTISDRSQSILLRILEEHYMIIIRQTEEGLKRKVLSLGRRNNPERYLAPARGVYTSSLSDTRKLLEEDILRHNLGVSHKGLEDHATQSATEREKKTDKSQRKRRTIERLEKLTPKVVASYEELYDTGKYSVEEVFDKLAQQSFSRFKEKLTAGQLRGIYNRRKKFMQ